MVSQASGHESNDSDADSLFNSPKSPNITHDTVATVPISDTVAAQLPYQTASSQPGTFVTQPTQPWVTPTTSRQQASRSSDVDRVLSSPSVQVAASSPLPQTPPPRSAGPSGPTTAPFNRGALNGGIVSAMGPPGTIFKPPTATQQTLDFSDHEDRVDSSDEERRRRNDIKPSVFMRGGRPIGGTTMRESPADRGFSDVISKFSYQQVPPASKRPPPDDMASAYASSSRNKKVKQAGPAKAQPVQAEMTLDEIFDFQLRKKVIHCRDILPNAEIRRIYDVLVSKRGHTDDALDVLARDDEPIPATNTTSKQASVDLTQTDEDELAQLRRPSVKQNAGKSTSIAAKYSTLHDGPSNVSSPAPVATMRALAKQQVTSTKTIADRYSTTARDDASNKSRKRLVRGARQGSVSPRLPSSPALPPPKAQQRKSRAVVSDDEDSGVGGEEEEDGTSPETEAKLLKFINEASHMALQDLSNQSEDIINEVIRKRPYRDLDKIRNVCVETRITNKAGKDRVTRRAVGDKLVDACLKMWIGYDAVDHLVARCDQLGKPIAAEMRQWGFDAFGSANGELEVLSMNVQSTHDSGIGTPSSATSQDDTDIKPRTPVKRPVLQQPKIMNETLPLKDYQITGMNWLALLYSHGLSGILADDMGLGKTCQVIAFLAHLKEHDITNGPHLIVAPGSTLENWIREIRRFCPSMRLEPYYGSHIERPEQQLRILDSIENIDVIVTTYDMASKSHDAKFLRKLPLVVCVYDEAHKLKNSTSIVYKALMKIPASQMRLLLTGTPLQNNLMELGSMLAFLMPGLFGKKEQELSNVFKHRAKVQKGDDPSRGETSAKERHDALLSQARIARARSMLTPFILRRKKHQVLKQMPKKTNLVEYSDLTGRQQELYQEIENNLTKVLEQRKSDALEASKAKKKATEKIMDFNKGPDIKAEKDNKTNILMDLRKAALHPLLFRRLYTDDMLRKMAKKFKKVNTDQDINEDFVMEDLQAMTDMELHRFCTVTQPSFRKEFALKNEPWMDSAKVQSLLKILKSHAENGHYTLIFSQFTRVMDILEHVFETTGTRFFRLDGQTKMDTRQDMIDLFTAEAEAARSASAAATSCTTPADADKDDHDHDLDDDDDDDDDEDIKIVTHRRTRPSPAKPQQKSKSQPKSKHSPETEQSVAVFMLSTRAGGQGINLTAADRVIIFDSGFNPHDDVQAENRAHRVGQTREVEVVKLVAKGTIEEDILALGKRKVKLDEMVAGAHAGEDGGEREKEDVRKESEGQNLVERMLAERLVASKVEDDKDTGAAVKKESDVSKTFMKGLMNAGLDMSAATAPIKLGGDTLTKKE